MTFKCKMLNIKSTDAFIDGNGVCFDVSWFSPEGQNHCESIFVFLDEVNGEAHVSRLRISSDILDNASLLTTPLVTTMSGLLLVNPELHDVIIRKLTTLNDSIAQALLALEIPGEINKN